jgi:FlaG/FlaF family flagellin (archaellin)
MMNFRKIRKNVKAVSPVISVLLMIVVAVAASLVTYAWVMGYLGFTTAKAGKAIQIQSVSANGIVYVQNVGDAHVTLADIYVNGTIPTLALDWTTTSLDPSDTANCTLSSGFGNGDRVTVKVTTTDGTFIEMTKTFP